MATTVLHILNGDACRPAFEEAGLDGELLVFREAMMCGPSLLGLGRDERLDGRARHLGEAYGESTLRVRRELGRLETRLDAVAAEDEVLLWFEDDLFCQVHLWYLLSRLGGRCRLRVVSGEDCCGGLAGADVARLALQAQPATEEVLRWGRRAWLAFAGDDPTILRELATEESPLPFGPIAVRLHEERFPALGDGLGRIERAVLRYVDVGIDRFGDLFRQFLGDESGFGLGDSQLFSAAADLSAGARPLLRLHLPVGGAGDAAQAIARGELRATSFSITEDGRAALAGRLDAVAHTAVARWLGGVRLPAGAAPFRWDPATQRVVRA